VRNKVRRLALGLHPQSLGVLCLGLQCSRLSPSRISLAHRSEPELVPDRAQAVRALLELERAGLVTWTPARGDELREPHYLLTRRGRRLARWLVAPSPNASRVSTRFGLRAARRSRLERLAERSPVKTHAGNVSGRPRERARPAANDTSPAL
jgi:hypothetical protein